MEPRHGRGLNSATDAWDFVKGSIDRGVDKVATLKTLVDAEPITSEEVEELFDVSTEFWSAEDKARMEQLTVALGDWIIRNENMFESDLVQTVTETGDKINIEGVSYEFDAEFWIGGIQINFTVEDVPDFDWQQWADLSDEDWQAIFGKNRVWEDEEEDEEWEEMSEEDLEDWLDVGQI